MTALAKAKGKGEGNGNVDAFEVGGDCKPSE
jgi:hypothetical protein